jgi:hypothetical protein
MPLSIKSVRIEVIICIVFIPENNTNLKIGQAIFFHLKPTMAPCKNLLKHYTEACVISRPSSSE